MHSGSILSFFLYHIKPYKWLYLVMMGAPLISSFYPFAYNYAIKLFIDCMVAETVLTYGQLLFPIMLFLLAQFTLDLVWRISNVAQWHTEPYVRRSILLNIYDYVQHHSYSFFQDNFTGSISSKIKGILDGYDKFLEELHHGLFSRLLRIAVNICALAIVNIYLGVFMFLWSLVYAPILYKLSIRLNQLAFEETEIRHSLLGQVSDKITNIISLFSFASRKRELKSLDYQFIDEFIPKQIRVYKFDYLVQIISGIVYLTVFIFLLFYMIHLRMKGMITIGDFAFVFGITLGTAEDIWHATISLQSFARSTGDLNSALSILRTPQQNLDFEKAHPLIVKEPKVEFKDVCFKYGQAWVFKDLNLTIQAGEMVGLVGHSGSGKSTLVNLLLRYFQKNQGDITVDRQNLDTVTQDSLRENIAVIPQDTMLFHRTLMENIRYGKPTATDKEVIEASKKAHIHDFIQTLPNKYNTYVGERGIKLSGGQRQRVAIARAILKDAPILILDEATSSLDSQTEQLIQDSLQLLIKNKKKTVIAIAHRLSTVKHMDRILVLDKGKIVEEGTHRTLIGEKKSLYKQLWTLQKI